MPDERPEHARDADWEPQSLESETGIQPAARQDVDVPLPQRPHRRRSHVRRGRRARRCGSAAAAPRRCARTRRRPTPSRSSRPARTGTCSWSAARPPSSRRCSTSGWRCCAAAQLKRPPLRLSRPHAAPTDERAGHRRGDRRPVARRPAGASSGRQVGPRTSTTSPSTTSAPVGGPAAASAANAGARRAAPAGREPAGRTQPAADRRRRDARATARASAMTGPRTSGRVTGRTQHEADDVGEEPGREQQRAADEHQDGVRRARGSAAVPLGAPSRRAPATRRTLAPHDPARRAATRRCSSTDRRHRADRAADLDGDASSRSATTRNSARITAAGAATDAARPADRRRRHAGRVSSPLAVQRSAGGRTTRATACRLTSRRRRDPRRSRAQLRRGAHAPRRSPARAPRATIARLILLTAELALDERDRHLDDAAARARPRARPGRPGSSSPARPPRRGRASPARSRRKARKPPVASRSGDAEREPGVEVAAAAEHLARPRPVDARSPPRHPARAEHEVGVASSASSSRGSCSGWCDPSASISTRTS